MTKSGDPTLLLSNRRPPRLRWWQKRCPRCGEVKDQEAFQKLPSGRRRSYCEDCRKEAERERYARKRAEAATAGA